MSTFVRKIVERCREKRKLNKEIKALAKMQSKIMDTPEVRELARLQAEEKALAARAAADRAEKRAALLAAEPTLVEGGSYDEERAFYGVVNYAVKGAAFAGPADGESAFKEADTVTVNRCNFALRYPFWHTRELCIADSELEETCRAPMWYCKGIDARVCRIMGPKALRECENAHFSTCNISSDEFGWRSRGVILEGCELDGSYFFFEGKSVHMSRCNFTGKYSFQYVEDSIIENSVLDTKDALWHAKRVTVRNCELRGEYLGWYCEDVVFDNCRIIGTQPFCYCKNLRLYNCQMIDCDLAFERSTVEATVTTHIDSVKNPLSGYIKAPSIGEIIRDSDEYACSISVGEAPLEAVCESAELI